MKRRSILAVLFGSLVLSSVVIAQSSQSSQSTQSSQPSQSSTSAQGGGDEQQLKDMENKWADAAKSGDTSALNSMLSDKYVNTEADGTVRTKSETVDRMKKSKVTRSAVSDIQVHMIDPDTAIVTGSWSGSGTDADGKPFDATERFTDTFVKEGGQWKAVATQSTPMKKPS
jgi:ketosteroid isomerase-like protein